MKNLAANIKEDNKRATEHELGNALKVCQNSAARDDFDDEDTFYDKTQKFSEREFDKLPGRVQKILDNTTVMFPLNKHREENLYDMVFAGRLYGIDLMIDLPYGFPTNYRERISDHLKSNNSYIEQIETYRKEIALISTTDEEFKQLLEKHKKSDMINNYKKDYLMEK